MKVVKNMKNMKNIKNWKMGITVLGAIGFIVAIIVIISRAGSNDNHIYVYHFNPSAQRLEAEARLIPSDSSVIESVIRFMSSEPLSNTLVTTWPYEYAPNPEDLFQAILLEGTMLLAFIEPIFYDIPPLKQTLFKAAFVYTMDSLMERAFPQITDIKILVSEDYQYAFQGLMLSLMAEEGEDVPEASGLIYDGTIGIYNDPFLSRSLIVPFSFNHLHFVDETGTGLIIKTHDSEEVDFHIEERARYVLLLLIDGLQPEGAIFPIPPETRINNVIHDSTLNDVFIDLNSEFVERFDGEPHLARLMIYSIVNTLTADFTAINHVHFMIDAQQYEYFHGVEYFDQPFERDDTLLLSYILEREQQTWGEWE